MVALRAKATPSMDNVREWLSRRGGLFGCRWCAAASTTTAAASQTRQARYAPFARFKVKTIKINKARRHAHSQQHRLAKQVHLGETVDVHTGSPTIAQIVSFWENRRLGGNLQMPAEGFTIGDAKKNRKIAWCIAEAQRGKFREFLKTAGSATLTQDGRGKHLLVMLHGCNRALDTAVNHVSVVTTQGGATNLCVATLQALTEFCAPGNGRPSKPAGSPRDVIDTGLLRHICSIISWWFTDAAYNECAAGELLISSADAKAVFPQLRVVGRERAHTSRRVLERPQRADDLLNDRANRFLWNQESIAALIQHSRTVGDVFRYPPRK